MRWSPTGTPIVTLLAGDIGQSGLVPGQALEGIIDLDHPMSLVTAGQRALRICLPGGFSGFPHWGPVPKPPSGKGALSRGQCYVLAVVYSGD